MVTDRPLFFSASTPVSGQILLEGPEAHHAVSVMRMQQGEQIAVGDGQGTIGLGQILAIEGRQVTIDIDQVVFSPQPQQRITAIQALAKGDRSELAVQMLTEIGVDCIIPWQAQRCVARWSGDKAAKGVQRWQTTAFASAKQSRRFYLPQIEPVHDTKAVCEVVSQAATALVLDPDGDQALHSITLPEGDTVIIIGPEGGISQEELQRFTDAGAQRCRLGPHVLRTSTAGVVAAALLAASSGRWKAAE